MGQCLIIKQKDKTFSGIVRVGYRAATNYGGVDWTWTAPNNYPILIVAYRSGNYSLSQVTSLTPTKSLEFGSGYIFFNVPKNAAFRIRSSDGYNHQCAFEAYALQ